MSASPNGPCPYPGELSVTVDCGYDIKVPWVLFPDNYPVSMNLQSFDKKRTYHLFEGDSVLLQISSHFYSKMGAAVSLWDSIGVHSAPKLTPGVHLTSG